MLGGESMLAEKKLGFAYLPYGDVCKRSSKNSIIRLDDAEYEEFEAELLEAIAEETSANE